MAFKRTQIYLDPEEHRRLLREAAERGLSLTEYLRRVIGARAGEGRPRYAERAWDGITALFDSGAHGSLDTDDEASRAFEEEHRRSVSRPSRAKPAARRRGRS